MTKLRAVIENLDDVDEAYRDAYVETKDKDGKVRFTLDLNEDIKSHPEVVSLHNAHEAQKKDNRTLRTRLTEVEKRIEGLPEDWNSEEWDRLKEVDTQFKELKEKGEDDPDKKRAHEAEIQSVKKMHEQQLAKKDKAMQEAIRERDERNKSLSDKIQAMVVRDGMVRLLAENGVKRDVLDFVHAKLEKSVKVVEDEGEFKAVVKTDLDDQMPLDQFISKWVQSDEAKPFVEQAKGGGAEGGSGRRVETDSNPWSKAYWSMERQNAIFAKDAAKAERMAKAVGHKHALGAQRADAT